MSNKGMYVVVKMQDFEDCGRIKTIQRIIRSENDYNLAETFATKAEAEKIADECTAHLNSEVYIQEYREVGRPMFVARHLSKVKQSVKDQHFNLTHPHRFTQAA